VKALRGFTLIELLVVIVIIGVVSAGVLLAVTVTGRDTQLETESRRLHALLTYAREQAELQTRELGLLCRDEGYAFVAFDPRTGSWSDIATDESLRTRELPKGLRLHLVIEGRPVVLRKPPDAKDLTPHVMIFSNGDVTPFELTLERVGEARSVTIASQEAGQFELGELQERRT
jgi:general secretion pathway protein H